MRCLNLLRRAVTCIVGNHGRQKERGERDWEERREGILWLGCKINEEILKSSIWFLPLFCFNKIILLCTLPLIHAGMCLHNNDLDAESHQINWKWSFPIIKMHKNTTKGKLFNSMLHLVLCNPDKYQIFVLFCFVPLHSALKSQS